MIQTKSYLTSNEESNYKGRVEYIGSYEEVFLALIELDIIFISSKNFRIETETVVKPDGDIITTISIFKKIKK